jgi:hypothetical protein
MGHIKEHQHLEVTQLRAYPSIGHSVTEIPEETTRKLALGCRFPHGAGKISRQNDGLISMLCQPAMPSHILH